MKRVWLRHWTDWGCEKKQDRGKRAAIVTEDGKVKSVAIEPDNVSLNGELISSPLYSSRMGWIPAHMERDFFADFVDAVSAAEKVLV